MRRESAEKRDAARRKEEAEQQAREVAHQELVAKRQQAATAARLEALRSRQNAALVGWDVAEIERFSPATDAEYRELERLTEQHQATGDDAGLVGVLEQLVPRLERRVKAAEKNYEAWRDAKERALCHSQETAARRAGLMVDEIAVAWCGVEIDRLEADVGAVKEALRREDWALAESRCAAIDARLEDIRVRSEAMQHEAEKRQYIVDSLAEVLRQQGFAVGSPRLSVDGDFGSPIILHAARPDRREVGVTVPMSGPVEYEVDGYAKRVETQLDGTEANTCDEAEDRIASIHEQLNREFGVRMGELTWAGKGPLRRQHDALELPRASGAGRDRGRGQ